MASTKVKTLPSPIGGLNALDSIIGMPETDAISLINLVPQAYGCYLRKGTQLHGTGYGGEVQTLVPFNTKTGGERLYAFANGSMFNATTAGAAPAASLTGLISNIWQFSQFANSAGTHAIGFSGTDDGIWIDNAGTITRLVLGVPPAVGAWSNVDPKNLVDVVVHQRRVWTVEKDSTYGWYLPVDQIYGVAAKFDFGPLFKRGGYLQSLATWTVDDGDGADDMLVAISSKGEVAVYKGIDPTAAATWALTGVYYMGEPVSGRRFHTKVGGDIKFVTQQGLISLNEMLTSTKTTVAQTSIDSQKVQQPLSESASLLSSIFGWQCFFCAPLNLLMVNVPSVTSGGAIQFVENTINSGWCQFTNYDASNIVTYNKLPYFGTKAGTIVKGYTGHLDGVAVDGSGGTDITGVVQQAYSFLEAPAMQKQVGMYRPTFLTDADLVYGGAVAYDFEFKTVPITFIPPTTTGSRWDVGLWDVATWSGALSTQRQWSQAEGMGTAASFCFTIRSRNEVLWVGTDYTFISGQGVF